MLVDNNYHTDQQTQTELEIPTKVYRSIGTQTKSLNVRNVASQINIKVKMFDEKIQVSPKTENKDCQVEHSGMFAYDRGGGGGGVGGGETDGSFVFFFLVFRQVKLIICHFRIYCTGNISYNL